MTFLAFGFVETADLLVGFTFPCQSQAIRWNIISLAMNDYQEAKASIR